jgi:aryl-alcohol dehydrogenase-like predicted oxidoreductase
MSGMYGASSDAESLATIQMAIESGINLIDTGDFYGMGHNEMLIGQAIKGRRDKVLLSVKFGALRTPRGDWLGFDCRPASVKTFLAHSLTRLGVDYIDVYRPARLDPNVPIEETIGAISEMIRQGYVRSIGLSEVGPETIRRAAAVHPIADVQIEYSLMSRGPERFIFPVLQELGVGVTAYGVLSRGAMAGSRPMDRSDRRSHFPRFKNENWEKNQPLIDEMRKFAGDLGATVPQLAIAWALAKGEHIIPTLGSRTRAQLTEVLGALQLRLSPQDVERLEALVPPEAVAGTRYDAHQMKTLDSEKSG